MSETEKPPIWRTGFVFVDDFDDDDAGRAYLVAEWTNGDLWIFWWHPDKHWTSLRRVKEGELPKLETRKVPPSVRDRYAQDHEAWYERAGGSPEARQ